MNRALTVAVPRNAAAAAVMAVGMGVVMAGGVALVAGQARSAPPAFTQAQAVEGRAAYAKHCASCHLPDLGGGEAPPLAGALFTSTWGSRSTKDLFDYTSATMPQGGAALGPSAYASIVAYILQANGAVAGDQPLTPSTAAAIGGLVESLVARGSAP